MFSHQCDLADPNICGPCQQISDLNKKIQETKMALIGLRNERQKLKEQANHIHDQLIRRLPSEITTYIFQLCLPEGVRDLRVRFLQSSANESEDSRYTYCTPLILSAVCRRWRTIVHSTPQLWEILSFQALPTPLLVTEWIARAGRLPLSVRFYIPDALMWDAAKENAIQIIKALNKCPSIHWLNFEGDLALHKKIFPLLSCPSLKTLVLDMGFEQVELPFIVEFLGRSGCSLSRLSLRDLNLSCVTLLCQGIPTLQHLQMGIYSSDVAESLFAHLAEFSAVEKGPRYLPALRSLTLYRNDDCDYWMTLPDIFSTSDGYHHRRALESVLIHVWPLSDADWDSAPEIDKEALKRILLLREAGVKWRIQLGWDEGDMIEQAIARHYGIDS